MKKTPLILLILLQLFFIASCTTPTQTHTPVSPPGNFTDTATFAGGCFWCMESAFEQYEPFVEVISGYTGGAFPDPTYTQISSGITDHYEAIEVRYDPSFITYQDLLEIFWRQIDPTDNEGMFVDRGLQYRSALFYRTPEQQSTAQASLQAMESSGRFEKPIVTPILPAGAFYPAEEYHQNYHKKNPLRYNFYTFNSGRPQYRERIWGEEKDYILRSEASLRMKLTPLQYTVTQEEATEPPFDNEYWDNKEDGIYVDIVSGEPLFSSKDKYDSGTGWPSFTKPLEPDNIVLKDDWSILGKRTEVRSKKGDSHLGHLFNDGPAPTGLRYCMNSAALRFIPKEDLEKEGYGKYLAYFT